MKAVGTTVKALTAAAALMVGGSAFANTSLDVGSLGSIFLNVVDSNTGLSYVFDTGLNQTSFDGSGNTFYQFNLTGDANYQSFVAGTSASDFLLYDVVSGTINSTTGPVNAWSTITSINGTTRNSGLTGAISTLGNPGFYAPSVNNFSSSTTNSAYVNNASDPAAFTPFESTWSSALQINDLANVGSAVSFYAINFGAGSHTATNKSAVLTQFASTWDLVNGVLTYSSQSTAPVPLPTSWTLLLAGLALMGVIARRGKSDEDFEPGSMA